ncbi:MAG: hypothetical protein HYV63_14165 [Candidatus Schekmanbacteria bacterium]|nr:hypothetical protein [Candidatus Schekmanbacteria bacterium]
MPCSTTESPVNAPRVAVIAYHADVELRYSPRWLRKCAESVLSQTHRDFDILELSYGVRQQLSLFDAHTGKLGAGRSHRAWHRPLCNHAQAMNWLLDAAFGTYEYDYVFNINVDDYYAPTRFARQLAVMRRDKLHMTSTNVILVREARIAGVTFDLPLGRLNLAREGRTTREISAALQRRRTVIAHPSVCYARSFWRAHPDLCYGDEIPYEDCNLWLRALRHEEIRMAVLPDYLLYYRRHARQVSGRA